MQAAVEAALRCSQQETLGTWSTVSMLQGLAALSCPVPWGFLLDCATRIQPHLDWLTPEQQVCKPDLCAGRVEQHSA